MGIYVQRTGIRVTEKCLPKKMKPISEPAEKQESMRSGGSVCAILLLLILCMQVHAKEPLWISNVSGEYITGVAVSEDGSRVMAGTSLGSIYLYDLNGTLLWSQRMKGMMQVALAPDASLFVTAESESRENDKGAVRAYDPDGNPLWIVHTGWICGLGVSDDLGRVATGNRHGDLAVYDYEGFEELFFYDIMKPYPLTGVAMSADGSYVAYSMLEITPAIYVVNVDTWGKRTINAPFQKYGSAVHTLRFSGNGTYLLAANGEGSTDTVYLFTNRGVLRWKEVLPDVLDMGITADGAMCVLGSGDGSIRAFDLSGNHIWTTCMDGAVQSLSMTPQGDLVAAGSAGGGILLMDGNGSAIWNYAPERFPATRINAVHLSTQGNVLVAVVNDHEILFFSTDPDPPVIQPETSPLPEPESVPEIPTHMPFSIPALFTGDVHDTACWRDEPGKALREVFCSEAAIPTEK